MATATATRKKRGSTKRGKGSARANGKGKKRIAFRLSAEKGAAVYVAGSFNEWNPKKNKLKFKDGCYSVNIMLEPGKHEYKFVVDGTWCVDPECSEWAPNGLGSLNSVINVG
jgi:1,4-alpha-glucan branching enzyme